MLLRDKVFVATSTGVEGGRSFDELPPHLAMGIGMLKLVEPKDYIAWVGMRITETVFFILPPGESTDE